MVNATGLSPLPYPFFLYKYFIDIINLHLFMKRSFREASRMQLKSLRPEKFTTNWLYLHSKLYYLLVVNVLFLKSYVLNMIQVSFR